MVLRGDAVSRALEGREEERAKASRDAWEALTWTGESPVVPLIDFQEYIWYRLPVKYLTRLDHKLEILGGLQRMLEMLGYAHHAALCGSMQTKRIIQEWERDEATARAMLRRSMDASGVVPPDVDSLRWGSVMGVEEAGIHLGASLMLEKAIADGAFTPGAGNWRRAQKTIVETYLHQSDDSGRTHIYRIHVERIADWLRRGGPQRKTLLSRIAESLIERPSAPPEATGALTPLIRLLELAESGLRLTQKGNVPPEQVRGLSAEFGWWNAPWPGPHREDDVPVLGELRQLARGAGLVRLSKGKLLITPVGRQVLANPESAWDRVVEHFASGKGFSFFLMEPLLARLLDGPSTISSLHEVMAEYAQGSGWRQGNGAPITSDHMRWEFWSAARPLVAVGAITGGWPSSEVALTEFGRPTAIAILWHRATAPRAGL
jgi:hypothetical protein